MHFNNLIALKDIEAIPRKSTYEQEVKDKEIKESLDSCFTKLETRNDNVMLKIRIGQLNTIRNEFSRRVFEESILIMEPTCECTEVREYLEFYNVEEMRKEEYNTEKRDCVKFADGKILPHLDYRFKIVNGIVYQRDAGPLKHLKRTKKAKRMTALPDYPLKKAFKTYGQYLEYLGYEYNYEHQAYGMYMNPNGYWDWFVIGGRWPNAFLIPEDCHEYSVGNIEYRDCDRLKAPEGFQWVAAARKKDINWKLMYKERLKTCMKYFREYQQSFCERKLPEGFYGKITEKGIQRFNEEVYIHGESMYENFVRRGIINKTKYHAHFYGFLEGSRWFDHGYEEDPESDYINKLDEFIDSLDDETVLVAVDCHS